MSPIVSCQRNCHHSIAHHTQWSGLITTEFDWHNCKHTTACIHTCSSQKAKPKKTQLAWVHHSTRSAEGFMTHNTAVPERFATHGWTFKVQAYPQSGNISVKGASSAAAGCMAMHLQHCLAIPELDSSRAQPSACTKCGFLTAQATAATSEHPESGPCGKTSSSTLVNPVSTNGNPHNLPPQHHPSHEAKTPTSPVTSISKMSLAQTSAPQSNQHLEGCTPKLLKSHGALRRHQPHTRRLALHWQWSSLQRPDNTRL
jgi:hypothetical protein